MIAYGHDVTRARLRIRCKLNGHETLLMGEGYVRLNHLYVATFPRRWVWKWSTRGPRCEQCRGKYRVWICDDRVWRKLPRKCWKKKLCTRCFRKLVEKVV